MPGAKSPSRAVRIAAATASTVLVLWLAWLVVVSRTDRAAELVAVAEQHLSAGEDPANASGLALEALRADPLRSSALVILGMAADARGDIDGANAAMSLALQRSRRNAGAQLWLFDQRVRETEFAEALQHADIILRTQPDMAEQVTPALVALASDEAARPALAAMLASAPPWRRWYLGSLARQAPPAVTYAVLSGITGGPAPAELQPYLNRLIAEGDFSLALLAWLHFLPPDQSKSLPYAFNGDFEVPVSGLPFDWTVTRLAGATTDVIDTGETDVGHALRVVFADRRIRYRQVNKLLVLPPGRYELTGQVKTDGLVSKHGLDWAAHCAEGGKQVLAESEPVTDTGGRWTGFTVALEVPSVGCRAQWLSLESAAEESMQGTILYDRLAIRRAPARIN